VTVRANRNSEISPAPNTSSIISSAEAPKEHRVRNNSLMFATRKSLQKANETGRNLIFVATLQRLLQDYSFETHCMQAADAPGVLDETCGKRWKKLRLRGSRVSDKCRRRGP
jgi:hypothetical protein